MPRKKPFSVKQKKKQLQDKRERQRSQTERKGKYYNSTSSDSEPQAPPRVAKLNEQPIKSSDIRSNRYRLQFFQESKEEIEKNKKLARQPYTPVSEIWKWTLRQFIYPDLCWTSPNGHPGTTTYQKNNWMQKKKNILRNTLITFIPSTVLKNSVILN
ncbi:Hypothetical predicted protein [Octopus vulgaris]|uniref:Uncharacterized protein n=1 Tax=Octopus vulgaris TaxID=6645 RepID=A0AA36BRL9_OCTVU|nr:Hypothetical predicted protein [Octopus vulgaris]